MVTMWWLACAQPEAEPRPPAGPLDELLRFSDLQAKGTHNSYHVKTTGVPAWNYDHLPLPLQLEEQGVRQFELDVSWDAALGEHRVEHVPVLDAGTTCATLRECAGDLWSWSRFRPDHHPLFVLVETKDGWDPVEGPAHTDALEAELLDAWPRERLIGPDDLRRDHDDLRTALEDEGWPTLGELRGRALFVLHDGGDRRAWFVGQGLEGRVLFPDAQGDPGQPWSAVHTMNDAYDPRIPEVVAMGHLVRTRCDSDTQEAIDEDPSRRDQALASGAHFVSTDFPAPVDWSSYAVEIPGGTPSRCNPVSAHPECTPEAIEDLR
jgi:hypothetical protein